MPSPPPSVYETAPTEGDEPLSGASPCGIAAAVTAPQVAPAPIRAVRRTGSTATESRARVETRTPPSTAPGSPCPVAWAVTGSPRAAAYATASRTSSGVAASTSRPGRIGKPVWKVAGADPVGWDVMGEALLRSRFGGARKSLPGNLTTSVR